MTIVIRLLLLILVTFQTCSADVAFKGSTNLMQLLEDDFRGGEGYGVGVNSGYITGVSDLGNGILFCVPAGVSVKQIKRVVYNFMNANPAQWNENAAKTISAAFEKSWPCKS